MPDEPLKQTETLTSNTRITDGIISEDGGAGAGWPIALLVLVTFVAGFWFLTQTSDAKGSHQSTVAKATGDAGNGATQGAGKAAEKTLNE